MIKEMFTTAVDTVKENKVVAGVTAGVAIAGICYWKRKAIMKRYKAVKEGLDLFKECAKAECGAYTNAKKMKEEDNKTETFDAESEPVGGKA